MRRLSFLPQYDLAIIGGGVHGAAIALEAARAGYSLILLERNDFAAGASANSLKIIHGGLRYLQSLNLPRAWRSAAEQRRLLRTMPNLVQPLPCIMPTYNELKKSRLLLGLGMRFYDAVCNRGGPPGRLVDLDEYRRICGLDTEADMTGAAIWRDAQVHNSERLVLHWLITARDCGAHVYNYCRVKGLTEKDPPVLKVHDELANIDHEIQARLVIDTSMLLESSERPRVRGVNLVVRQPLSDHAVGLRLRSTQVRGAAPTRLLFFVPWRDTTMIGTWYFPNRRELGDRVTGSELDTCINEIRRVAPGFRFRENDIQLLHVGRLPVDRVVGGVPRLREKPDIHFHPECRGVLSVCGVKYTTAGLVADQVLRRIETRLAPSGKVREVPTYGTVLDWPGVVDEMLHEYRLTLPVETIRRLAREYGSRISHLVAYGEKDTRALQPLPGAPATVTAEIWNALDCEMAQDLSDVLVRRMGIGATGLPASDTIDYCAALMARRLRWSEEETSAQRRALHRHYQRVVAG